MNSFLFKNNSIAFLLFMVFTGLVCAQTASPNNLKSFNIRFQERVEFIPHKDLGFNSETRRYSSQGLYGHFFGYEDTRCPTDVVCAAAGHVNAYLKVLSAQCPGAQQIVEISGVPKHAFGYRFSFVKLTPQPSYRPPTDPRNYVLTILVEPDSSTEPCKNNDIK